MVRTVDARHAPQCSLSGHSLQSGFWTLQTVLPSSISPWLMSPGRSASWIIAVAPSQRMSNVAFAFGLACSASTRLIRRFTFPSSCEIYALRTTRYVEELKSDLRRARNVHTLLMISPRRCTVRYQGCCRSFLSRMQGKDRHTP